MSITILHGMQVFTADDPEGKSSQPVIVVMTKITDQEQPLSDARWTFLFIGPLPEFHQRFIHRMSREFDQGHYLDRFGHAIRGSDFVRHLNTAIEKSRKVSATTLRRFGISAVTWSREDAEALGITELTMVAQVPFFMDSRYGFEIKQDSDAQRLVLYAMSLKRIAREAGKCDPLYTGRPMLEQPARLRAASH